MWPSEINIVGEGLGMVVVGKTMFPKRTLIEVSGKGRHPDARVRIEVIDGVPECTEVTLTRKPEGRPLQSADMTFFAKIDSLVPIYLSYIGLPVTETNPGVSVKALFPASEVEDDRFAIEGDLFKARALRRRGPGIEELERVAAIYLANIKGNPVQAVQDLLPCGSARTAARRVGQARAAKLLSPTTRGKKQA